MFHRNRATTAENLLSCRLLELKTQEAYYNKIVARYMQFCTHHSKDLESAFACLSVDDSPSSSPDAAQNSSTPHSVPTSLRLLPPSPPKPPSSSPNKGAVTPPTPP